MHLLVVILIRSGHDEHFTISLIYLFIYCILMMIRHQSFSKVIRTGRYSEGLFLQLLLKAGREGFWVWTSAELPKSFPLLSDNHITVYI